MIVGIFVLAGIALVGTIILAWFEKTINAEIAGLAGVAIGGVLGHLVSPEKKD